MKTTKNIIALLLTLLMIVTLVACGGGKTPATTPTSDATATPAAEDNSAALVGVWEEIDIDNVYTFNANGTGSEYFDGDTWEMTWKLIGKTLTMDFGDAGVEEYEVELSTSMLIVHGAEVDFEYIRK